MKKYSLFIFMIAFVSCHTKQTEKTLLQNDTAAFFVTADTSKIITGSHHFWEGDAGRTKGLAMIRNRVIPTDSLTANNIIQILKKMYPEIKLYYTKYQQILFL